MKLPGKEISLQYTLPQKYRERNDKNEENLEVKLFVDMNVGIGGDIWPAAQLFCRWILLEQYYDFFFTLLSSKRILELGSGNALVSILVEKAFQPKEVLVTDLQSHVPHIVHNLDMNACKCSSGASLDWMDENDNPSSIPFDVVLALEW